MHRPEKDRLAVFFFSSRRRHTRCSRDWSSDVCSSDLQCALLLALEREQKRTLPESVVASRWRDEVFEPTVAAVPDGLWERLPAAEIFHQRSEERRVGKECRYLGEREPGKKTQEEVYVR